MPDEKPGGSSPPAPGSWDATQWHEVQKGETLSKIAQRYYGDASLYTKIFEANRDTIKDANLIRVGQKIRIP
jgi:nucleoid-associated protein YgaU